MGSPTSWPRPSKLCAPSSGAGLELVLWPLLASDIIDGDAGTPNIQYVDDTDDVSPSGFWFYQATAYNSACDAEGPW